MKTKKTTSNPSKLSSNSQKLPQHSSSKEAADSETEPAGERVQKVLARGGLGSRREIERWIVDGKLSINGKPVKLGDHLIEGDHLQLNGRVVVWQKYAKQPIRVLIYHKPTGEVVTRRDPDGRPVIFTQLPKLSIGRWIAVGRLDINTQGLLLVTNNGELANRLMHPSSEMDREYAVRILGDVNEEIISRLKQGVELEDGEAHFDDVQFNGGEGANKWYHVTVKEGRNRLVRRLWESQNKVVSRLMRVRYGPIVLPENLRAQSYHELDEKALDALLALVDMRQVKANSFSSRKFKPKR